MCWVIFADLSEEFAEDGFSPSRLLPLERHCGDPLMATAAHALSNPTQRHGREFAPGIPHRGELRTTRPPHDAH